MARSSNEANAEPVSLTLPRRLLPALYEAVKHAVAVDGFPAGQEKAGKELAVYLAARFPELTAGEKKARP